MSRLPGQKAVAEVAEAVGADVLFEVRVLGQVPDVSPRRLLLRNGVDQVRRRDHLGPN